MCGDYYMNYQFSALGIAKELPLVVSDSHWALYCSCFLVNSDMERDRLRTNYPWNLSTVLSPFPLASHLDAWQWLVSMELITNGTSNQKCLCLCGAWTRLPTSHIVLAKCLTWIQDGILFLLMALRWWQLSPAAMFVHCLPVPVPPPRSTPPPPTHEHYFQEALREFLEIWHKYPHVFKDGRTRRWPRKLNCLKMPENILS